MIVGTISRYDAEKGEIGQLSGSGSKGQIKVYTPPSFIQKLLAVKVSNHFMNKGSLIDCLNEKYDCSLSKGCLFWGRSSDDDVIKLAKKCLPKLADKREIDSGSFRLAQQSDHLYNTFSLTGTERISHLEENNELYLTVFDSPAVQRFLNDNAAWVSEWSEEDWGNIWNMVNRSVVPASQFDDHHNLETLLLGFLNGKLWQDQNRCNTVFPL